MEGSSAYPVSGDTAELEAAIAQFDSRIRARNRFEFAMCALVALVFFGIAVAVLGFGNARAPDLLAAAGALAMVTGAAMIAWQLRRRASVLAAETAGGGDLLERRIAQLAGQRDAARSAWLWYVGPIVPGLVLMQAGSFLAPRQPMWLFVLTTAAIVLVLGSIVVVNRRQADRLQREIDRLSARRGRSEDDPHGRPQPA